MPNVTISPNMGMPVPNVGVDPGPDWANNINSSLSIIDGHNHSLGEGVQITPDGLNISSDLSFEGNNATVVRSVRFLSQISPLVGISPDLDCIFVSGVDLYYNDGNGNTVRITQAGSIAGTPGSISGLVAPASASYSAISSTFIWESGVNIAAGMDNGPVTIRNFNVSSNGITLQAPNSIPADISYTLPAILPTQSGFLKSDSSGTMSWSSNSVVTKTSNYTATLDDYMILVNAGSGPVQITLPAASGSAAKQLYVIKIDSSPNAVTIARTGSDLLDGETAQFYYAPFTSVTWMSDGVSNWYGT